MINDLKKLITILALHKLIGLIPPRNLSVWVTLEYLIPLLNNHTIFMSAQDYFIDPSDIDGIKNKHLFRIGSNLTEYCVHTTTIMLHINITKIYNVESSIPVNIFILGDILTVLSDNSDIWPVTQSPRVTSVTCHGVTCHVTSQHHTRTETGAGFCERRSPGQSDSRLSLAAPTGFQPPSVSPVNNTQMGFNFQKK